MRTSTIPFAALLALGALAPACGDDAAEPPGALTTREQFCGLVQQVDTQFTQADAGGIGDFEATRTVYASLVADIERLEGSLDQVDAEARDAVGASLAGARGIAAVIAEADDEEAAAAAAEAFFADAEEPEDAELAATWIADNCDVDIDG